MSDLPADAFTNAAALEACTREPIQIPGVVQAHGALVAVDPLTRRVTHASATFCEILGLAKDFEPLGSSLEDCVGSAAAVRLNERLAQFTDESHPPVHEFIEHRTRHLDVLMHRHARRTVLEFLPAERVESESVSPEYLQRLLNLLSGDTRDVGIWSVTANLVRDLTGLHRVMIYRFDDEWNGEVIGEARRDGLESYLGLSYPASDIPVQARRLYEINLARYIPDVYYTPVVLRAHADCAEGPLDLSLADLRGISPVHIEYLRNMGVRATFVLSLLVGGRLWGMIACHHYDQAAVPLARRKMLSVFAHSLSNMIGRSVARAAADSTFQANLLQARMLATASAEGQRAFPELLARFATEMCATLQATALVCWSDEGVSWWGTEVSDVHRAALIREIRLRLSSAPDWNSCRLGAELAGEEMFGGVLAAQFEDNGRSGLALLRLARDCEVYWAGDPQKVVTLSDDGLRLSPRRSFAAFREVVRGRSAPWSGATIQFVADLKYLHARFAVHQAQEVARERARALEEIVRELQDFDYTIAHDLRAPLRALVGFASLLRSANEDDSPADRAHYLDRIIISAQFMSRLLDDLMALAQSSRADVHFGSVSCNAIVAECVDVLRHTCTNARFEVGELPDCRGDVALMKQLWLNLLDNAAKYSSKHETPLIQVDFAEGFYRVRDNGVGFEQKYVDKVFGVFTRLHSREEFEGTGIGMAVAKRVVERHGGVIEAEGRPGNGATFRFRL
jgi:light-regulated signal transduction histidine kinase (bacteriophytochrome)